MDLWVVDGTRFPVDIVAGGAVDCDGDVLREGVSALPKQKTRM